MRRPAGSHDRIAAAALSGLPVIIGAGLAGLACALSLAPMPVVVLTKSTLGDGCSSVWAQGGIAVAQGEDDCVDLHVADTLAAGDGLCDADAVARIIAAGPAAIEALESWGVVFDRRPDGSRATSLEAAHSRRRVLHAGGGDTAGRSIMRALVAKARATDSIRIIENAEVVRLVVGDAGIQGLILQVDGESVSLPTSRVVLATGGVGGLWPYSTNPSGAMGQGLALAALAEATIADAEFVQFHPTAVDIGRDPMPLASEALRGEGAVLVDAMGRPVVDDDPRGDLAPRDVVARAVWRRSADGAQVFLDGRDKIGAAFPAKFPTLYQVCREAGIDPITQAIPVRPAAHYHMGGVAVDAAGRSSVEGLWVCGETASTGLHGANRLASNSLLEAVVTGRDVARDLLGRTSRQGAPFFALSGIDRVSRNPRIVPEVRRIMGAQLGLIRDGTGIAAALTALKPLAASGNRPALAAFLITASALLREESRGSHFRSDFPTASSEIARSAISLDDARRLAAQHGGTRRIAFGR